MSTVDKLARTKPKENAGSRSSNRFEYQINWGLNLLLKMEEANEDYIMILDYHDDIVVCNSDSDSEYIDFYQIKTNISNMWTLGGLVGDNKKKTESSSNPDFGLSIIAKLISHVRQFEDSRKLYFVTNSRLAKSIYGASDEEISFDQLKPDAQNSIKEKVKKELDDIDDCAFERLVFIQNQMNVNDYEQTMLGKLAQFLKRKFNIITDIDAVYTTLIGQLRKKNNCEIEVGNKEELLKNKAISHLEFKDYLKKLSIQKGFTEIRREIISDISNDVSFYEKDRIYRCLGSIFQDLMNYEDDELQNLYSEINNKMSSFAVQVECKSLWNYTNSIYNSLMLSYNNYKQHDEFYIKALILYAYTKDNQRII